MILTHLEKIQTNPYQYGTVGCFFLLFSPRDFWTIVLAAVTQCEGDHCVTITLTLRLPGFNKLIYHKTIISL